jgi:hypothetical protein
MIDRPTDYSEVTWRDSEADRCNDRLMKNILEVFGGRRDTLPLGGRVL